MSTKGKKQDGSYNPLNEVDAEWNEEAAQLLGGMFGFEMNQQAIPSLVIVQGISTEIPGYRQHIGEIYNTVTGEFHEELEILIVGMNTPRAVLPYPFDRNKPQLCASVDGIRPYAKYVGQEITAASDYDEQTFVIPEECDQCPLFESPLCTRMFRYFGLTPHNNVVFTYRAKRSAMDAAKKLNFWLNQLAQRARFMTFTMTTVEKPSPNGGSYFVPEFAPKNDATDYLKSAFEMNKALEDRIKRVSQAQLESGE